MAKVRLFENWLVEGEAAAANAANPPKINATTNGDVCVNGIQVTLYVQHPILGEINPHISVCTYNKADGTCLVKGKYGFSKFNETMSAKDVSSLLATLSNPARLASFKGGLRISGLGEKGDKSLAYVKTCINE